METIRLSQAEPGGRLPATELRVHAGHLSEGFLQLQPADTTAAAIRAYSQWE